MLIAICCGAYDNVIKDRLVAVLRQKGIPRCLVGWVNSFMSERTTTLVFDGKETARKPVTTGIPQGSLVLPILFLLYSLKLLDICNPLDIRAYSIGFINDINILA